MTKVAEQWERKQLFQKTLPGKLLIYIKNKQQQQQTSQQQQQMSQQQQQTSLDPCQGGKIILFHSSSSDWTNKQHMTDKQEKNQSKFTHMYASCKHGKDPGILTFKMAEAITLNIL